MLSLSRIVHAVWLCGASFSSSGHIQAGITSLHCLETMADTTSSNKGKESRWTAVNFPTAAARGGGIKLLK